MNMILRALMVSVWFMALTFPLVVLKVDALNDTILFLSLIHISEPTRH